MATLHLVDISRVKFDWLCNYYFVQLLLLLFFYEVRNAGSFNETVARLETSAFVLLLILINLVVV